MECCTGRLVCWLPSAVHCVVLTVFLSLPLLLPSPPPPPPSPTVPCSKVCGTPTPAEWPGVVNLPLFNTFKARKIYRRRVKEEYTR